MLKSQLLGAALAVGIALPTMVGAVQQAGAHGSTGGAPAMGNEPAVPAPGVQARGVLAPATQDTAGKAIFTGKGLCYACHGPDGKGTPLAPNLTDSTWLNIDGTMEAIVKLVNEGVATPKEAPMPMPPKGGAVLTDEEVQAVARYVLSLSNSAGNSTN